MLQKRLRTVLICFLFITLQSAFAKTGALFQVSTSGMPLNASITLCLNGYGPLSCQIYSITGTQLTIATTIPGRTYSSVGIKVNTLGVSLNEVGVSCTLIQNGYCIFSVSDTSPAQFTIKTYTIGGTISDLAQPGLILQNNGGDNLAISAGATSFTFPTSIPPGGSYNVTIFQQPTGQTCTVSNGSGSNVMTNITNVLVECTVNTYTIGGIVSGLTGADLVIQNNGGDDIHINAGTTTFEFSTPVPYGGSYAVFITQQPPGQICTIVNNIGVNVTANITNVGVYCQWAYTANFTGLNLSIIDRVGFTVVGTVPITSSIAIGPFSIVQSPLQPVFYITVSDNNTVVVLDIASNTIVDTIALPASSAPKGIVIAHTADVLHPYKAYTANQLAGTVSVIDITTNTFLTTITTGTGSASTGPYDIAATPDGSKVYVTNTNNSRVYAINTTTDTVSATIAGVNAPRGVCVNPVLNEAYVVNQGANTVSVINTSTNGIIATITEPSGGGNQPFSVLFNLDGSKAYVTNAGGTNNGPLLIITTATRTVALGPANGANERGLALSSDGAQLLVTQLNVNQLYFIDPTTNLVTHTLTVGADPRGVIAN